MITTSIFVGTLFLQHDRNGLFLAVAQWIVAFSIFILSIKYGIGGKTKLDILVFVLAIITIILWKITQNNILALGLSIIVDLISFTPTLIKAYKSPETEDWKFYLSDTLAGLFSILSISLYTFANLLFPMYILLINGALVGIILLKSKGSHHIPNNK
jgi:hypothetical protein